VVEKDRIIDGSRVQAGDVLLGLASSGPHSNGYSLIRKVLEVSGADLHTELAGRPLIDQLLAPTRIYVKSLLALFTQVEVHALCHVTGGGLPENLPRVLPANTAAVIDTASWQVPAVFEWLREQGNIERHEWFRTFNCGVGMVVCVAAAQAEQALAELQRLGETAWRLGHIEAIEGAPEVRFADR
jgi:phosphoribosylformylglycinamidine cyclo-ligase